MRGRVLVLMHSAQNASLVRAALSGDYDIATALPDGAGGAWAFDLALVDGVSLHRYGPALAQARAREHPLFLPVVLLTDRDEPTFLARALRNVVDEIVRRPVPKAELRVRVDALLRTRDLSQQVIRMQRLYENERAIAERFQAAALPRTLPQMNGTALWAHYTCGHRDVQVGGDWYDALELEDGRLVMSIGDVCGSGLDAAVLMAHVRQVIRGVAHIHPDPRMMLDAVNRNLRAEYPGEMVSALVAVLDSVTSTLEYANAGHVPPVLCYPDGGLQMLETGDLPLGVDPAAPAAHAAPMPLGCTLVMYTDGLTEAHRDPLEGQRLLERVVCSPEMAAAANPAHFIHDAIIDGDAPDDIAILVVRRTGAPNRISWTFDSSDQGAFAQARERIVEHLCGDGADSEACLLAETIFAELIGNVVRYAPGPVEVVLDRSNTKPVLHVLDNGPSFSYAPRLPVNPLSESGRGLYLVKELSREFNVSPRPQGGSHARVVFR